MEEAKSLNISTAPSICVKFAWHFTGTVGWHSRPETSRVEQFAAFSFGLKCFGSDYHFIYPIDSILFTGHVVHFHKYGDTFPVIGSFILSSSLPHI